MVRFGSCTRTTIVLLVAMLIAACNPLGPAATPTRAPQSLPDQAMQQAALSAIQEYAASRSYQYRNPSFTLLFDDDLVVTEDIVVTEKKVVVHAMVGLQTRQGLPFEEYDALFPMVKTANGWQAERVGAFSKVEWDQPLQRGPLTLKSAAGFSLSIPAGWAGYVMPEESLIPANVCGVGTQVVKGVPLLVAIPAGYSPENVPVVLRVFQQCPRAPTLGTIQQFIEGVRKTDKDLRFEQLVMTQLGGRSALAAVMVDENDTVVYDYYVIHRDRQIEFVIQAHGGVDAAEVLSVLSSVQLN